jgi:hypothetical protein
MGTHPIGTSRVVDGSLECAVQVYRHPSGKTITAMSTVHLAEPEYFESLVKLALREEEAGAEVFLECLGTGGNPTEEEREAIDIHVRALMTQQVLGAELFNLPWVAEPKSALGPFLRKWSNADVDAVDLIRLLGPSQMDELHAGIFASYERMKAFKEKYGEDSARFRRRRWVFATAYITQYVHGRPIRAYIAAVRSVVKAVRFLLRRKAAVGIPDWVVPYANNFRECVAANDALACPKNVVVMWHPDHLKHMGQIWMRNGFVPDEAEWLTACHELPLSVKKTATDTLEVTEAPAGAR